MSMPVSNLHPRGTTFARYAKALGASGDVASAVAYAEGQNWFGTPGVELALKSAVSAMGTADMDAAMSPIAFDLSEYLRPQTILGKLAGLRRVPFQTRLILADGGTAGKFVAENAPIPVSSASLAAGTVLAAAKVCGIVVVSKELLRLSTPSAESALAADLARALAQAMDAALVDPANAGDDATPASLTNGAPSVTSTGATLAAVDTDLKALVALMIAGNIPMLSPYWIMSPTAAMHLALLRGSGGASAFSNLGPKGGSLLNIPVITSTAATDFIVLVDASEVLLADDGQARIELAEHASLQLDDAPDGTASGQVSLWQNNLVALKGTRFIRWLKRRPEAAVVLTGIAY